MNKYLYAEIRKNWQYLNPVIKGLAFFDYQLERLMSEFEVELHGVFKRENFKVFYWAPRLLGIGFIIFLSSLSLNIFDGSGSLSHTINFAITKLMPSLLMTLLLFIAWKKEFLGGFLFIALFIVAFGLIISEHPLPSDLVFFGPILIIGSLFLVDSYLRRSNRGKI